MSAYLRLIYDRLEFLEFKQNILFLKQPQHKATVFFELCIEDFLNIRDFTIDFEKRVSDGEVLDFIEYEKKLFEIWPPIKSYPASSTLVAKALMNNEVFNSLFQNCN